MTAHRAGVFERISWILDDWEAARANQADVEQRMTEALDQLGLTALVTSIHGQSPVGAAAILAETGDLTRFTSARAIVKLAGLAPRERLSGTFAGKARLSGAGRPGLRIAAWRAVWGCLHTNDVYAARYRYLISREHNKLKPTQAQTVLAAALLRQLWAVITTGQACPGDRSERAGPPRGGPRGLNRARGVRVTKNRSGPAFRGIETPSSALITGGPDPSSNQPDQTLQGTNPITAMQGPTSGQAPRPLDAKRLTLMSGCSSAPRLVSG